MRTSTTWDFSYIWIVNVEKWKFVRISRVKRRMLTNKSDWTKALLSEKKTLTMFYQQSQIGHGSLLSNCTRLSVTLVKISEEAVPVPPNTSQDLTYLPNLDLALAAINGKGKQSGKPLEIYVNSKKPLKCEILSHHDTLDSFNSFFMSHYLCQPSTHRNLW